MNESLMDKLKKIGGSEVGQKISAGMKEFFQGPNQIDNLVEEATAETLDEPDWATNLEICEMVNGERINSVELIRGIKKRMMLKKKNRRVQYLTLVFLQTVVENCQRAFSEVAAERVLDDMVTLIDDPQTQSSNRNKALMLIQSWSSSNHYLPVYQHTYKSLQSRGIRFPDRDNDEITSLAPACESNAQSFFSAEQMKEAFDVARNSIELLTIVLSSSPHQEDTLQDDLSITLFQHCRESQYSVQRMIETIGGNKEEEALLFEALNVNDQLQKVISKYEEQIRKAAAAATLSPSDDDHMIAGTSQEGTSKKPPKDDFISF